MSNPCTTCQPMPSCIDGLDRYNLQGDNYLFVLNCPPGYNCETTGLINLICCDGTEFAVSLPESLLAAERTKIIKAMLDECGRRMAFCTDPPGFPYPPGSPSDPTIPDSPGAPEDPTVPGSGTPSTPPTLYYSKAVTVGISCPDGSTFIYTLPAGRYIAFTQAEADARAQTAAYALARTYRMCLSGLPSQTCAGSAVTANIAVSGPGTVFEWRVVSGTVPTGMTVAEGWITGRITTISGTPTTPGSYTFTVRARSVEGNYIDRSYTICIVGMTPDTLPDGSVGTNYSETLTAPACATAPLSWQVTAGALPDGLTLDETTGVISGEPTTSGTFNFTVTVQTEAT